MHQPLYTTSALTLAVPRWKYKFSQPIVSICGMLVMRIQPGINKIAVNDFFFLFSALASLRTQGSPQEKLATHVNWDFKG